MNLRYPAALIALCLLPRGETSVAGGPAEPSLTAVQNTQDHAAHERPSLPTPSEIAALPPDGGEHFNRLVFEKSPYLIQHAANPVDWYPWGEEALARAKELDRPIFLSVGYATCHWCHVMERESFEDEEVAALLNEFFVCIKVDREERPDLDQVYMTVTQAMTGRGGWPMTVVMNPEGIPFFAATYIPKESRFGRRGMMDLLPAIDDVWRNKRADLEKEAARIVDMMQPRGKASDGRDLGADDLELVFRGLASRFDAVRGGFGGAPKFPVPHSLFFLLQYSRRRGEAAALHMVESTLSAMRRGGMYDQVGFGFHRYSTDDAWFVPHFEKMLYDQALHVMALTAAWQITGKDEYRRTAGEILEYVRRDMTSPAGGFYSAEDADSEGEEGRFYVWSTAELAAVLGEEEAALYGKVYGVEEQGNFLDEATQERNGRNIPFLAKPLAETAAALGMEEAALRARLDASRRKLFAVREERIHPLKDDKILTDWNGLMIAAFAQSARAFDEPEYEAAAVRAGKFVLSALRTADGRLLKRYRAGEAGLPGTLEDYAFLGWGLLELYETTFDVQWLKAAVEITDEMITHFPDEARGGFFSSADDGVQLFVRGKEFYDGAIPSGNSVAALNLLRLGRLTGETRYEEYAQGTLRAASVEVASVAGGHTQLFAAVDFATGPSFEVVIAGDPEADDTKAMLRALRRRFLPHKVVLLRPAAGEDSPITALADYAKLQPSLGGKATAYVCRDFTCAAPTTDVETMLRLLTPKD